MGKIFPVKRLQELCCDNGCMEVGSTVEKDFLAVSKSGCFLQVLQYYTVTVCNHCCLMVDEHE